MQFVKSKTHYFSVVVCMFACAAYGFAQTPPVRERESEPKIKQPRPPRVAESPRIQHDGVTSERSIKVDPRLNLSLCVTQGNVKVSGWSRNEVRVFVSNGSKFGFRVLQKSPRSGEPVLITVARTAAVPGGVAINECISGEEVEIDVPETASVGIKGRETATTVDNIRKVTITNAAGDIAIRSVAEGIRATTYEGNVTVTNSRGPMTLESASGNVVVFTVGPSEVGDVFRAKTSSGTISLQKLEFRLAEINSVSGSVVFTGDILSGGSLSFTTSKGAIRLAIPQNTSTFVTATYGFGTFNSDFPLANQRENVAGPVKSLTGMIGGGDATLRLTTHSGRIVIVKN